MPYVKNGGLFIPTSKQYKLGDEVFMLLSLMDDKDRLPVAGKIIWVTPAGAQNNKTTGIGVQFSAQDNGTTRNKIEGFLAGALQADRPTHTM
jgi:type IV pilus assembly protein PilZ